MQLYCVSLSASERRSRHAPHGWVDTRRCRAARSPALLPGSGSLPRRTRWEEGDESFGLFFPFNQVLGKQEDLCCLEFGVRGVAIFLLLCRVQIQTLLSSAPELRG